MDADKPDFWRQFCCYVDDDFSFKLMQMADSLESFKTDLQLQQALEIRAENSLLGNMGTERLLALFRKSCYDDVPFMERLCPCSLLTQWLNKNHMLAGGADPRQNPARQHLLEMGVSLVGGLSRRHSRNAGDKCSGRTRGFGIYLSRQMTAHGCSRQ